MDPVGKCTWGGLLFVVIIISLIHIRLLLVLGEIRSHRSQGYLHVLDPSHYSSFHYYFNCVNNKKVGNR